MKIITQLFPMSDARSYQILFLLTFLSVGVLRFDFSVSILGIVTILGVAFSSQAILIHFQKLPWASVRSAAISAISLILLLRSQTPLWLGVAAALAIFVKIMIRFEGKHIFNPTNFGVAVLLLFTDSVWVSPGQWGTGSLLAAWFCCLGIAVVTKSKRFDISLSFIAIHTLLLVARVTYLGQRPAVIFHQLGSGSLLLFTFFMISDPRSTPDSRFGRIVFAVLVALVAHVLRFYYFNPNALFYALFFVSPITILLDKLWQSRRFEWSAA